MTKLTAAQPLAPLSLGFATPGVVAGSSRGAYMDFCKLEGPILGVPVISVIVYWDLFWGPHVYENLHMGLSEFCRSHAGSLDEGSCYSGSMSGAPDFWKLPHFGVSETWGSLKLPYNCYSNHENRQKKCHIPGP